MRAARADMISVSARYGAYNSRVLAGFALFIIAQ
jgi:hypothetical protein